jgi:hypothetical protein
MKQRMPSIGGLYSFVRVILFLATVVFAGCARSTVGAIFDDGMVFMMFDVPGGAYTLRITVEGFEPFEIQKRAELNGAPFPLMDRLLPGGTEVTVQATEYIRVIAKTFRVDGNILIRLRLENPRDYESKLVLEQLV